MKKHEFRHGSGRGIAAAALCATLTFGVSGASAAGNDEAVVVAQTVMVAPAPAAVVVREYPAYMSRAVAAAAQGPEALRRYLWRTRMIYNFYYPDFIPTT